MPPMSDYLETAALADSFARSLRPRGRLTVPGGLLRALWRYLAEQLGEDWQEHRKPQLAARVQALSSWYADRSQPLPPDPDYHAAAYAAYFVPMNFPKLEVLLPDLLRANLLKPTLRVLDLGSGPGTVGLSLIDALARLRQLWPAGQQAPELTLDLQQVDLDAEFVEAAHWLINYYSNQFEGVSCNLHPTVTGSLLDEAVWKQVQGKQYDLIVFCNVLNELATLSWPERAKLVQRYSEALAPDGTLVLIEPAVEEASLGVREVQTSLIEAGWTLFAPCYITAETFTPEACRKCWWVDGEGVAPIRLIQELGLMRLNTRFTWALLRKDGRSRHEALLRQDFEIPPFEPGREELVGFCAGSNLYRDKHFRYKLCDARHGANYVHLLGYKQLISDSNEQLRFLRPGDLVRVRPAEFTTRDDGTPVSSDWVVHVGRTSELVKLESR